VDRLYLYDNKGEQKFRTVSGSVPYISGGRSSDIVNTFSDYETGEVRFYIVLL